MAMPMVSSAEVVIFGSFKHLVASFLGEVTKSLLFEGFQAGCHVVLRGRRGTL